MNDEKIKHYDLSLLAALAFALLFFWFGWRVGYKEKPTDEPKADTVIVTRIDTFFFERPTEIVRYVTRHDTIFSTDTAIKIVFDTISGGSAAIIPIESAIYKDSTENAKYEAFLSGYRANLDSIRIECLQTETTIRIQEPPRRFGVGFQLGVGMSAQGVAAPYLGVGVQYRIW